MYISKQKGCLPYFEKISEEEQSKPVWISPDQMLTVLHLPTDNDGDSLILRLQEDTDDYEDVSWESKEEFEKALLEDSSFVVRQWRCELIDAAEKLYDMEHPPKQVLHFGFY